VVREWRTLCSSLCVGGGCVLVLVVVLVLVLVLVVLVLLLLVGDEE